MTRKEYNSVVVILTYTYTYTVFKKITLITDYLEGVSFLCVQNGRHSDTFTYIYSTHILTRSYIYIYIYIYIYMYSAHIQ
jgi:hypothetical protein